MCCRLKSFESQMEKATREYNMEKLTTLKAEVDEATRKFEECQDSYATEMFDFLAKEQVYTDKIAQVRGASWFQEIVHNSRGSL